MTAATITVDGKRWGDEKHALVGSVKTAMGRDIQRPPVIGQYPVFVEQFGNFRMFTYPRKIKEIEEC